MLEMRTRRGTAEEAVADFSLIEVSSVAVAGAAAVAVAVAVIETGTGTGIETGGLRLLRLRS